MATETKIPKLPLHDVQNKADFHLPQGATPAFIHNGAVVDLRKIDRATAEALANDKKCAFLQWAPGKGPNATSVDGKQTTAAAAGSK